MVKAKGLPKISEFGPTQDEINSHIQFWQDIYENNHNYGVRLSAIKELRRYHVNPIKTLGKLFIKKPIEGISRSLDVILAVL